MKTQVFINVLYLHKNFNYEAAFSNQDIKQISDNFKRLEVYAERRLDLEVWQIRKLAYSCRNFV